MVPCSMALLDSSDLRTLTSSREKERGRRHSEFSTLTLPSFSESCPYAPFPGCHAEQCALQPVMRVCHAFTQSFPPTQVARESGPPHMKSFVTRVSVGEFVGEGEGKSKKISKKNAAIAVLEELKKLPPLPTVERVKPRIKKKTKSIVRVRTCLKEEGVSIA